MPPRHCKVCGQKLTPKRPWRGGGKDKLYCGMACRLAHHRRKKRPHFVPPTSCTVCIGPLPPKAPGTLGTQSTVCGAACKEIRTRRRRAAASRKFRARIYAGVRRRHLANPEKARAKHGEYHRRWTGKNPDTYAAMLAVHHAIRKARALSATGECTKEQWKARQAYYAGRCWIPGCGKPGVEMDHVIPLSRGGSNWPANLRPACRFHNRSRKHCDWRAYLARLANESGAGRTCDMALPK